MLWMLLTAWPAQGLSDAVERRRGVQALKPADGTGPADAYRLHDFLAQHGTRLRGEELIPASFWDAAADTGSLAGSAYLTLGQAAQDRFLYGYADRFFRLAISADVPNAHENLRWTSYSSRTGTTCSKPNSPPSAPVPPAETWRRLPDRRPGRSRSWTRKLG